MSVAVVVPLQTECLHRARAWSWVRRQYRDRHPDWEVRLATGVRGHAGDPSTASNGSSEPRFCKAALVNPAISEVEADIVVMADADVWCEGLAEAVRAVEGGAPWAIPHGKVRRLTEEATAAVLRGEPWDDQPLVQPAYLGIQGGGYVVAKRETLLEIPLDARFLVWGQEDASHAIALHHLAGPAWRGNAPLIHLFHPPAERLNRKIGSVANRRLWRQYLAARSDPKKLRELVEEGRVALNAHQPKLHRRSAVGVG